jgi:tetratricopeptide (TPR) repeat protein
MKRSAIDRKSLVLAAILAAVACARPAAGQSTADPAEAPVCQGDVAAPAPDREQACTTWLKEAGATATQKATAYVNRGWALGEQNRLAEAIADYGKALRLRPAWFVAYNERGLAQLRSGQLDAAARDYQRALKLNPDAVYSHYGLGLTLIRQGKTDPGQGEIAKARQLDPKVDEVFRELALAP